MGLTEQQARAYLALLDVDGSNVNELAKVSRVPRSKLYEILLGLNRKGLVDIIPDTPQRFRANPLTALYDTRLEELRAEEEALKRSISDLALQFTTHAGDRKVEQERDFLAVSHGRTQYLAHVRQLVNGARNTLLVLGDKLFLARLRLYEDLVPAMAALADKVALRIVVPENVVESVEGRRVFVDELASHVRRSPLQLGDASVWIRDQEEYVQCRFVPNDLHPSRGSDRIVLGRDGEMASVLHRLVDLAWASGRPLGGPAARGV